jgi:hypothetical protein
MRLCDTLSQPGQRDAFQRFAGRRSRTHVRPSDGIESALESWRKDLETRNLQLKVGQVANNIRMISKQQVRSRIDWPQRLLEPPDDPRKYPHVGQLDPVYVAKVDDYLEKLRHRNPLDPLFAKQLQEATLVQKRGVLLHAPCILISGGRDPASITGLRDITAPEAIRDIFAAPV